MKNKYILSLLFACFAYTGIVYSQDAMSYYNQGIKLKDDKKYTEALEKFRKAISLNPKYSDALFYAGWCQNELQNYSAAISYLHRARQVGPPAARTFFELGYAFEKTKNNDSAYYYYYKCLDLSPTYSLAYKQMGNMAYEKDEYTTAMANYKKYEENAKDTIKDYYYWYKKGFLFNTLKEYSNAKEPLLKSLAIKNDYINTYLELGFAAAKLKQDDEAISYYRSAMAIDPNSHVPLNGIADVYRDNKKNLDEAMNWYQKTLQLNATERKACFGMGYCLNSKERYNDAIPYLKKAIEKEPTYTAAYIELGYAYYMTSKDADAETNFSKAIELSPKNENARYYACLLYIKQKNKAKAQKMVDELKALSSRHVSTLQPKVDAL